MAGGPLPTIVVVDSDKSAEDQLRTMITLYRPPEVEKRIMGTKAKAVGAVLRGRRGSRKAAGESDRAGEDTLLLYHSITLLLYSSIPLLLYYSIPLLLYYSISLFLYSAQEQVSEGVGGVG